MKYFFKSIFLILGIACCISSEELSYEINFMTEKRSGMSEQLVRNLVNQNLNGEISRYPYYKAWVNVYQNNTDNFFVVYLARSDIYLYTCFKLEIDNYRVVSIDENYIEQQVDENECRDCPDPDIQVLLSCPTTEFSTGPKCMKEIIKITSAAGLKTVYLEGKEESLEVIKSYLSCPKLIMWARIGHGNINGFILGEGIFNASTINSLKGDKLKGIRLHANSCTCHQGSFENAILNAGAYFFSGGDIPLKVGYSEKVTLNFLKKIITEKREIGPSLKVAMEEENYDGFGLSGVSQKPLLWWPGNLASYISVSFPDKSAKIERYSFCKIKWNDNINGNVKIDLIKRGNIIKTLAQSTESDGIFKWPVDDIKAGSDYKIRITGVDSSNLFHEGEPFSIIKEFIISDFPYNQNFDDMGTDSINELSEHWKQLDNDDFDWTLISGPTPSAQYSNSSTGAKGDHTGKGKYLYIEASDQNNPNKKANLITPIFNLKNLDKPELSFWAHMKSDSNSMGNIYVDISVDGIWNNEVIHLQKDHGETWFEVRQNLSNYQGDRVQFRFRAVTGTSWCSDMCIDDFMITDSISFFSQGSPGTSQNFTVHHFGPKIIYKVPRTKNKFIPVSVKLYNLKGKIVKILANKELETGYYSINPNIDRSLARGMYLCRFESPSFSRTISVIIEK